MALFKIKIVKKGFTLIELLIVIAIMGIMATLAVNGYIQSRKSADISIQTDILVAQLREARIESQNTIPDDKGKNYCLGYQFVKGEEPKKIKVEFKNRFEPCGESLTEVEATDLQENDLQVTGIVGLEFEVDSISILYFPPKGEFLFYNGINLFEPETIPDKIQIETQIDDQSNSNYITILKSGIIQKELKSSD